MESVLHRSRKTGLLKERTKRFQAGTIHVSQETAQAGAMGKAVPPKERHEGCPERNETLKEVGERAFEASGIANQQSEKINRFIPARAVLARDGPDARKHPVPLSSPSGER